jgi:hypothetical protein
MNGGTGKKKAKKTWKSCLPSTLVKDRSITLNYYSCGNNAVVVIYLSILFTTLFCTRCVFNELWYAFKSTYVSHVRGCLISLK